LGFIYGWEFRLVFIIRDAPTIITDRFAFIAWVPATHDTYSASTLQADGLFEHATRWVPTVGFALWYFVFK
jgi:hypothetical protein